MIEDIKTIFGMIYIGVLVGAAVAAGVAAYKVVVWLFTGALE